jgi:hypothetical protein
MGVIRKAPNEKQLRLIAWTRRSMLNAADIG